MIEMKRSLPRFLSFRRSKRRMVNSCSSSSLPQAMDDSPEGIFNVKDVCHDYEMKELNEDERSTIMCTDMPSVSPQSAQSMSIEAFVLSELLTTEKSYVNELESLIEHYVDPFETVEMQAQLAPAVRGRTDLVFGNLRELYHFHSRFVLPDLIANENSPSAICRTFLQHRHRFLSLYYTYCQNKSTSESVRKEYVDNSPFFAECQRSANHPLPLSAYLLKPVQRITKYQLLLRELERHCRPEVRPEVSSTLATMLELLAQINAAIHQLHISGFNGDLRLLGALRLQSECDVYTFNRKKKTKIGRSQRRHLFLFDGGVLFCKKRSPPNSQPSPIDPEYFEHKMCIPMSSLGFNDVSRTSGSRFEVWDDAKSDAYAIDALESGHRDRWVQRLQGRFTADIELHRLEMERQRPKSWASTMSSDSSCSTSTRTSDENSHPMDTNGNTQTTTLFSSPIVSPLHSPSIGTTTESDHVVPHTPKSIDQTSTTTTSSSSTTTTPEAVQEEEELVEDV